MKYRAWLYYLCEEVNLREIHFLVTKDLEVHATVCCFYIFQIAVLFMFLTYIPIFTESPEKVY